MKTYDESICELRSDNPSMEAGLLSANAEDAARTVRSCQETYAMVAAVIKHAMPEEGEIVSYRDVMKLGVACVALGVMIGMKMERE